MNAEWVITNKASYVYYVFVIALMSQMCVCWGMFWKMTAKKAEKERLGLKLNNRFILEWNEDEYEAEGCVKLRADFLQKLFHLSGSFPFPYFDETIESVLMWKKWTASFPGTVINDFLMGIFSVASQNIMQWLEKHFSQLAKLS